MSKGLVMVTAMMLSCSILIVYPALLVSNGQRDIFAGYDNYKMGPMGDMIEVSEDEVYDSRYFAVMGDMNLNKFTTDADWLTTIVSNPLVLETTDLECRYSFDQGDARDDSGNGHDGTSYGANSSTGVFDIGQSMIFDGDDYILIPHTGSLNITREITVEAWIYPTFTDTKEHMIVSKGGRWSDDDSQDYELTMDKDRPLFQIKIPGSNDWYGAAPDEPIAKNTWHHVAGVYDGTRFMIYIDGINQTKLFNGWDSNYKGSVYTGGLPAGAYDLSIGRREPASWGSLYFKGSIDEVRIFDDALPSGTILEHATKPGENCINITGTPGNDDVGSFNVLLNITDGSSRYAERKFTLNVVNTPPRILTEDVKEATQDVLYSVDYEADDEGQGTNGWELRTDAEWLNMDQVTGLLSGTPSNDDVGAFFMNVTFNDGNGGKAYTQFPLIVRNVNDVPEILTEDVLEVDQDHLYEIEYSAMDPDVNDKLTWAVETDAQWLDIDAVTGVLNGIPGNDDVGTYEVNVSVTDPGGLGDFSNFELEVLNLNDIPFWVDLPENTSIEEGEIYTFDVNATDVDIGDEVTYWIMSDPETNISINKTSGIIEWKATREPFSEGSYQLDVQLRISDGKEMISHNFTIDLIVNPSPSVTLLSPENDSVIIDQTVTLSWEGEDPDGDILSFDVYLGSVLNKVKELDENTKIAEGLHDEMVEVESLNTGNTYYWTVVPIDRFSRGICTDEPFSFFLNTLPEADLLLPGNDSRISAHGVELSWNGSDDEMHDITFDVYLSRDLEEVAERSENALIGDDLNETELLLDDLSPGTMYYWTVVPWDGYSFGIGVIYQFTTNHPPAFAPVPDLHAEAGKKFTYQFRGLDGDDGDVQGLTFHLRNYIGSMSLQVLTPNNGTATLVWTPKEENVGNHTLEVFVTDGIDETNISVNIEVLKAQVADESGEKDSISPLMFILPVIGLMMIIILAVLLFILLKGKKKEETEDKEAVEEDLGEEPTPLEMPPPQTEMESGALPEPEQAPIEGTVPPEPPEDAPAEEIQPPEPEEETEQEISDEPPDQIEGIQDTEPVLESGNKESLLNDIDRDQT